MDAKRFRILLCLLIVVFTHNPTSAAQQAAVSDTTAYTTTEIRLRAKPSAEARVLDTLEAGTRVRLDYCAKGWCRVTVRVQTGYLLEEFLTRNAPKQPAAQHRSYKNSAGEWVPAPQRPQGNQPPAGATALCRDGTYSFSRSRRGTCSHHGGVAQWL
jgi:uncharacterized protein YraI